MPDRVCVFIDGSNFYHGLKENLGRQKLKLDVLVNKLVGGDIHVKTYYYNAPFPQQKNAQVAQEQQKFFNYIKSLPDTYLILGRLEQRSSGELVEKGIDVKLAADMVRLAYDDEYDRAVIISCDGDFVPAINFITNELCKLVTVVFVDGQKGYHIKKACANAIKLDEEFMTEIWR